MAEELSRLESRIAELEAAIRRVGVTVGAGGKLGPVANFSAGSCTNNCTAACTIGCTSGCTKGCAAMEDFEPVTLPASALGAASSQAIEQFNQLARR